MEEDMEIWVQKTAKMCLILWFVSLNALQSCKQNTTISESLPYFNEANFTPIFIVNKAEIKSKITHQIADFSFLNQDNKVISQKNIENKIHIADFIFTTCGSICPTMTSNVTKVGTAFKNDSTFVILSYSVTPWIDTPKVLKKYQLKYKIDTPNWHFLTGEKAKIYELARKSYFAEENMGFSKDSSDFLHTEHVLLVDKSKRIRGIYNGTLQLDMEQLIKDIKTLKKEN